MFKVGELVVYSAHGLCKIDDICERTFNDVTRTYYVIHPVNDSSLIINIPVDSDKVVLLKTLDKEEAEEILQTFNEPGIKWIEDVRQRNRKYTSIIHTGNRHDISQIANTLIRKSNEAAKNNKKLYDQDRKLLTTIEDVLFKELATALDTSSEEISERVNRMVQ